MRQHDKAFSISAAFFIKKKYDPENITTDCYSQIESFLTALGYDV